MDEFNEAAFTSLTPREIECLRLVGRHLQTKEIARALNLSPHTVNTYIKSACDRLGVANRREAARRLLAYEARFAPPTDRRPAAGSPPGAAPLAAKLTLFMKLAAYAAFALAAFMADEAVIVAVHQALNPDIAAARPHDLRDMLAQGRRGWPDIFITGRPLGRLYIAFCFAAPALALLKGDLALRAAALTMVVLVFATLCARFGPAMFTLLDALQLAVYLALLRLTSRLWAKLLVALQLGVVTADIAFYIQGIIDGRTWELVQIAAMLAMAVIVLAAVLTRPRSLLPR